MSEYKENIILMDEAICLVVKKLHDSDLELTPDQRKVINDSAMLFMQNPELYEIFHAVITGSISGELRTVDVIYQ